MATNTILGVFDDPIAARRAVERLRDGTLDLDDVSIVSRATESGEAISSADDVSAGEGAAVGAVWGGLIGLASLLIPGVGPFVAIGALGAALAGAVTGAVVGGIAAALIDFGDISEPEAREYEKQVHAGMTLVAVKAREDLAHDVRQILANAGAESIRDNQTGMADSSDLGVRVATYDASGQRVSMAEEYGQPSDPTTVSRRGVYDLPQIDRPGNMVQPLVEAEPTIDEPVAAGRAHAVEPRHSGTYADDDRPEDVLRPEAMGVPPSNQSDMGTHADTRMADRARSVGTADPTTDTTLGTGRAGQVQPRASGEGVERSGEEDLTTPDAPAEPRATGADTNLPDPKDRSGRTM
jgi:uncharacterized membrane protein